MGELSKKDAEAKRDKYVELLAEAKEDVREDFEEMDFENAVQRNQMEEYIEDIETVFGNLISSLNDMEFS